MLTLSSIACHSNERKMFKVRFMFKLMIPISNSRWRREKFHVKLYWRTFSYLARFYVGDIDIHIHAQFGGKRKFNFMIFPVDQFRSIAQMLGFFLCVFIFVHSIRPPLCPLHWLIGKSLFSFAWTIPPTKHKLDRREEWAHTKKVSDKNGNFQWNQTITNLYYSKSKIKKIKWNYQFVISLDFVIHQRWTQFKLELPRIALSVSLYFVRTFLYRNKTTGAEEEKN